MSDYFDSHLPLIRINNKNYPDLHHDDQELIIGISNIYNPREILDKYNKIFKNKIDLEKS